MTTRKPWILRPPVDPSPALAEAVGGHPLVAQLLAQRGIDTPERALPFLDPNAYTPSPPAALVGLERAAQLLHRAIEEGRNILVWGDFDVDGQTSTSLLVAGLWELTGPERVRYHVPNRFTESHGIRPATLERYLRPLPIGPFLQEQGVNLPAFVAFLERDALSAPQLEAALAQKGVDLSALKALMGAERIFPDVLRAYLRNAGFQPDLLLTCDTGIADAAGIGLAKDAGLTVIVTDHHDLPAEFGDALLGQEPPCAFGPEEVGRESVRRADAIVNPKFQRPEDPLRTLPGVGVAYKLMQRLYELAGRAGEATQFLDLVALGIVADVAEQVHDARYLLQRGLERLRHTRRTGLQALMQNARINPERVSAEDIGFQIGPRMNALGRLEDATVAVELLTTRDALRAGELAAKMERLNGQRRLLTSQIHSVALEILARNPHYLDFNAIVLAHPQWHAGIVGIVASRIVEEYAKPAALILNPPGEAARGSARSVPGVDIGASIAACAEMLHGHGGHPGAAGLSLAPEQIDPFRRELSRQIDQHRFDAGPLGLIIDAEVDLGDLSLEFVAEIQRLAPFGNGNPEPHFLSRNLTVARDQRMGKDGSHRRLLLRDGQGHEAQVVWFSGGDAELPEGTIDLVYTVGINEYKGNVTLQLRYGDARPAGAALAEGATSAPAPSPARAVRDLRGSLPDPADLPPPDQAAWLAEGPLVDEQLAVLGQDFRNFYRGRAAQGKKGRPLVLWSAPPSGEILAWLLESVDPSEVILVAAPTAQGDLASVLKAVTGMAKYALTKDGRLPVAELAARLATTEAVIRHSLLWLDAKGVIELTGWEVDDVALVAPGANQPTDPAQAELLHAELDELLSEVRAYRRYFQRMVAGDW